MAEDLSEKPLRKWCRDCGKIKLAADFWRRKQSPDGLALYCKECFGQRNADAYRGRIAQEGRSARPYRRRSAVPAGMKYCANCGEVKPVAAFGRNRSKKSGLASYCRPCHNRVMADIKRRKHGSQRNYLLKHRYGVTEADVRDMVRQQGGICVICLRNAPEHVDHNHETGLVRGLLCFGCNGGLGQFADDSYRLRQAAGYLDGETSHARVMVLEFGTPTFDGFARRRANRARGSRSDQRGTTRHYHLTGRYGIGDADVRRIIEMQRALCPICCNARGEHVDHCHRTGAVRGILCPACNTGMGQFKDDPIALRRAADYLSGELVQELVESDGRTRLSFTIPDVDPASVPTPGWEPYRAADGRERKALLEIKAPWIRTSKCGSPRAAVDQGELCPCRSYDSGDA